MTTLLFTETKWPQSLGLRGAAWEGGGGGGRPGKDGKRFLLGESSGRQPSAANWSFGRFTAPPSTPAMVPPYSLPG